MAQKNDTAALIISLLVTLGLIGGGIWWFSRQSTFDVGALFGTDSGQPEPSGTAAPFSSPEAVSQDLAGVPNVPSGLFSYGGSTTWAPIRGDVDSVVQTVFPSFRLRYTNPTSGAPGSGSGVQMLLDNQLTFAQSSRSLRLEEYQAAEQRGFTLREIPVALEGIAIAVHPNLEIPGITLDQLRDIYTGQLTNWSQIGGPNVPITPYSRPSEGGTVEFFTDQILGGQPFGNGVRVISTTTQALREVAANPGAIYYASAPEVVGQCTVKPLAIGRTPNNFVKPYRDPLILGSQCGPSQRTQLNIEVFQSGSYPITRSLFVVVKQNGQIDQQAGEAYANLLLTDQGQSLIEKAGFVPLR